MIDGIIFQGSYKHRGMWSTYQCFSTEEISYSSASRRRRSLVTSSLSIDTSSISRYKV
jgi:hypothetical protein